VVTGRNLPYGRALDIIQNEEYLSAVDSSIIRRNFYPEFPENNYYFPDFQQNNFSDFDDYDRSFQHILSRDQWYKTFFIVADCKKNNLEHFSGKQLQLYLIDNSKLECSIYLNNFVVFVTWKWFK